MVAGDRPREGWASVVADLATADLDVLANNGVRDRATAWEYLAYGADGVSVGRASDDPAVLRRVARAVDDWTRRRTERGALG